MSIEKAKAALESSKKAEIELKETYNATLKRFKEGEAYFKKNGVDKHLGSFTNLLKQLNILLRHFPNATDDEMDNGFDIPKSGGQSDE